MNEKDDSIYKGKNFDRDLWQVLSKIKELLPYTKRFSISYDDYFNLIPPDSNSKILLKAELHILERLQDMGTLKIEPYDLTMEDLHHLKTIDIGLTGKKATATWDRSIPSFSSLKIEKKKFETIYRKYSDINSGNALSTNTPNDTKPSTDIDKNSKIGYLLFHDETIEIGESGTGKFKLVEILCDHFGKAKTVDVVFDCVKANKDKNKIDASLGSDYMGHARKITIMENQMREINRTITRHAKSNNLKGFKYRLTLKSDRKSNNKTVWLEERLVGRRGK
jgi:hypothetical protein